MPLGEGDFEVLPGHLADAAAGGALPAARTTVVVRGEVAA